MEYFIPLGVGLGTVSLIIFFFWFTHKIIKVLRIDMEKVGEIVQITFFIALLLGFLYLVFHGIGLLIIEIFNRLQGV